MVTRALLLVALLAKVAHADDSAAEDDDPGFNLLGFRLAAGGLPIDSVLTTAITLGLELEHPVFRRTRVLVAYDWMWLTMADSRDLMSPTPRPTRFGTGHRAQLGLRRELTGKTTGWMHLFLDGELGAGMALINDSTIGAQAVPVGFLGARVGYDVYSRHDDSPSRTFEIDLMVRMLVTDTGLGWSTGIGFAWGN